AYRKALAEHTPGFARLTAAKKHIDLVMDVSPNYKPAFDLQTEILDETRKFETDIQTAETLVGSRRFDEALTAIASYRSFEADEVLVHLPDTQRSMVTGEMDALKANYSTAAVQRAQKLQQVHLPIQGRTDEDAVREAYGLLSRAGGLGDDPLVRLKLDILSDKISAYYMDQAKRYLEKPLASGVGLGWLYLGEAQHYKPNLETVKDEMTRYAPVYQLRAKLSIGVVFRDQSSRRENAGFADQLADAIATSL